MNKTQNQRPTNEGAVVLRPLRAIDAAEFTALCRASKKLHRGWLQGPTTPRAFAAFLKRSRQPDNRFFVICLRGTGVIVGAINVSQIFYGPFCSAYLGYFIGEPYAGRGYMTQALHLALGRAFTALKLHRVEANIQPGNEASIALVRRAGFVREGFSWRYLKIGGRWRDHERWALLVEDWRAKRKRVA